MADSRDKRHAEPTNYPGSAMYRQENVSDEFHEDSFLRSLGTDLRSSRPLLALRPLPDVLPSEWVEWCEFVALFNRSDGAGGA